MSVNLMKLLWGLMFKQLPRAPSLHKAELSQAGRASPNTFWDTGGGKGGRGNLTRTRRIGGGPAQKTAGKTRRVREKGLRGKTACVRHRGNEGLSEPLGDQQLICLRSSTIIIVRASMRLRGQYREIEISSFKAFFLKVGLRVT